MYHWTHITYMIHTKDPWTFWRCINCDSYTIKLTWRLPNNRENHRKGTRWKIPTYNYWEIRDKISVNFDRMNERPETKTSREDEKILYIKSQFKGTCRTFWNTGTNKNMSGIKRCKRAKLLLLQQTWKSQERLLEKNQGRKGKKQ